MAKVIIKVDAEAYLCAFSRARKYDERVRRATSTLEEVMSQAIQSRDKAFYLVTDDSATVAGFAVLQGELVGLWSSVRGLGDWLVRHAVQAGAFRLNCFDGYLVQLYERHGFREVRREANYEDGDGADVVYMEHPV